MSSALKRLSYVIFPKRCELCGEVIELDKTRCVQCEQLKMIEGKICRKCGREVKNCTCSRDNFSPDYKAFCAPYYFEKSTVAAVYRLKNHGFSELAFAMAESIVKAVTLRFENVEFDIVTCVPMSPYRKRVRGYNQSELLAKEVAKQLDTQFDALLYKNRRTRSQRKSSAKQRRANLYGAFSVIEGKSVSGKTVLIVDDVKTTGSTLSELAFTLKDEGATVYAAAFTVTNKH
ncbi:MAG: ComF family protein [Eubacterium sp.]|nr:ComF family protein [Eubacterium sp.]